MLKFRLRLIAVESKVDLAAERKLAADINDKLLPDHRGVCPGCDW